MLGFCEKCHDSVEYIIKDINKTKNIKGIDLEYKGKNAYCKHCGEEIFVSEIRDYNLKMLEKAYKENTNIITISEIDEILNKYNIGKRPLSLLLGWGETTITRYLNGDIPSKQYSSILKKILIDSDYFYEILEQNKSNIKEITYKKCIDSLNNQLEINNNSKIYDVVTYIINQSRDITPLALQKLLYYSQSFYYVFISQFLFNDDCEAWQHGPVYRNVYSQFKNYRYNPIESIDDKEIALDNLSEIEKEIIDNVIQFIGCYSGKILEKMTHMEMPWILSRIGLNEDEYSNNIIKKQLIIDYFSQIRNKYKMNNISDIKDYSTDLFNKISVF